MCARFLVASALAALALSAHAATDLPDACGKADVKFDVKTEKAPPTPASFDNSQARIIFIASFHSNFTVIGPKPTTRLGLDGQWIGAAKGDSYFISTIAPGEHHLCAAPQLTFGHRAHKYLAVSSFTAEPGKTYFFQFKINSLGTDTGSDTTTELSPLDDYQGKYRIQNLPLATSTSSQ